MPIAGTTDRTREADCPICDLEVTQTEGFLLGHSGTHWNSVPHKAPCGRWCMGGGIQKRGHASLREAIDSCHGQMSNVDGVRSCPDCGPTGEIT